MSMFVFKKCCFCIDLRLGCFIIAYLTLVFRIISLLYSSARFADTNMMLFNHEYIHSTDLSFHKLISIISIMILVFEILMCIALIVGLHKRLDQHLEMFYVGSFAFLVMGIVVNTIVMMRYARFFKDMAWLVVAVEVVSKLIYIYFLTVIRSYYYKMRQESNDTEKLTAYNGNTFYARTAPILITTKP